MVSPKPSSTPNRGSAKKRKILLPKHQGKKQEDYEKWLDDVRLEERKELKNVIVGEAYDPKTKVFDFTTEEIQEGPMYRSIPRWKYDDFKKQYRPMNRNFINLITMDENEVEQLNYRQRTQFKMGIHQLLTNLNFISSRFKPFQIRGPNPTSLLKTRLMKHFH